MSAINFSGSTLPSTARNGAGSKFYQKTLGPSFYVIYTRSITTVWKKDRLIKRERSKPKKIFALLHRNFYLSDKIDFILKRKYGIIVNNEMALSFRNQTRQPFDPLFHTILFIQLGTLHTA